MHISLKSGVCGYTKLSNELARVWSLTFDALRVDNIALRIARITIMHERYNWSVQASVSIA